LANKKKKTPKHSNKDEKKENAIILAFFLIFIIAVAYVFYFLNIKSDDVDIVATLNGNDISREELDWWYRVSILPEFRDAISKKDFMVLSLVPQEILIQQAKELDIIVTDDDIENLLGLFIIENGMTLDEFETHLTSREITIDEIKKSFETRSFINKLFEKENIVYDFEGLSDDQINVNVYVDGLIDVSDIKIFSDNIEKLILRNFEATEDNICGENLPIIRLYTTSFCELCEESAEIFDSMVSQFSNEGKLIAYHWNLDEGDNLLTSINEKGIPKDEVDIFKKYSPNKLVPALVLGCKYKKIGKFGIEDKDEFKSILNELIGE